MSALHEALTEYHEDLIKWLLDHGIDANEPDEEGNTPLMVAAINGLYGRYPRQVRELIERGADIHARDRIGRTPLMLALDNGFLGSVGALLAQYRLLGETPEVSPDFEQARLALLFAIYNNDVEAVDALIDAGADPNCRNDQGRTPLMMAVELGHAEVAASLLTRGADVHVRETGGMNWTALHVAANEPQLEVTRLLLEHGAQVDARDDRQWTPLIWAASTSAAMVRLLLEHGADVHAEDAEGDSALSQAGEMGVEATFRTLLDWGAASHPEHLRHAFYAAFTDFNQIRAPLFIEAGLKIGLSEAALLQDMDRIKSLLADGVDQDEINRALLAAAGHASPEIVRLLLEHGADPNAAFGSQTALMMAYRNLAHVFDNIEVLLQAGADVNARNELGETPFTMMHPNGRLDLMRKMLKRGADVNVQSVEGKTALMEAARAGETAAARFLLKHGAQINLCDKEGRTALMFAVAKGKTRMVRLLLEHGATTAGRATDGSTALTLARRWIGKRITKMLLDAGATQ